MVRSPWIPFQCEHSAGEQQASSSYTFIFDYFSNDNGLTDRMRVLLQLPMAGYNTTTHVPSWLPLLIFSHVQQEVGDFSNPTCHNLQTAGHITFLNKGELTLSCRRPCEWTPKNTSSWYLGMTWNQFEWMGKWLNYLYFPYSIMAFYIFVNLFWDSIFLPRSLKGECY